MSDQHRAAPAGALGRWRTRRVARTAEATSKHAEAVDREAQAIERRTQALRNHHALTTALGVKDQPTTGGREESAGDRELGTADRVAIAATSVIVLAITSVIMLVIIGAQIAFYAKSLGEYRYVAELDWLPGVDNEQGLDLAFFTPFATEGVVWACTLMAVVLVMLNRKSDAWTRAMWFFASIQAVVNTWHALDMDDLAGAFVKGGLSLAGPFVVHLFILWVRHVRTGRTLAQARQHSANRWRQRAKRVRLVLRTIAAHVLHPRVAFGALSIYVGARHLTYDQAWFIAAHPYRRHLRSRYIASEAKARAAEALGEQGAHALAEPTDEQGARETSPAEHGRSPEQQDPPLATPESSAAGVLATDTIAVPGLGSQADDDERERALFAQLEAEFAARDEQSPNCSPDCSPTCDGECSHPLTSASIGEHPDASTPEHPGEHPGERPGERSRAHRRAPRRQSASTSRERTASTPASTAEQSPASTREHTDASTSKTDKERVIERYWALHHAGLLDTVNQTELAHQMGIRPSSFRRTWAECVKGKHLDPNQTAITETGKENN